MGEMNQKQPITAEATQRPAESKQEPCKRPLAFNVLYLHSLQIVVFSPKIRRQKGLGWLFYEHGCKVLLIIKKLLGFLLNTAFSKA